MVPLNNKGRESLELRELGKWALHWDEEAEWEGRLCVTLFCQERNYLHQGVEI